ncbi:putative heat repeat containing protein [Erysiphe necator]|uniref:Putative heat repeat containing protein n=1 Tax=Uncinula necator TaxID=52586 RepID=A0A0B1PFU2_UNCNE|nr:putative heat repeat containing protein [Erysiphe necator]
MSSERIDDVQVSNLLEVLRTDATIDAKVNLINQIKSAIKQNNVPETCIVPLFEATRTAMTSQQAAIVSAGFTTLGHLLSRISRQEPKYLLKESSRTLPLVIEKMGDSKEKYRQLAAQCLTTFWNKAPSDVEKTVKSIGLTSKNPKMKDACMSWIVQTHQESAMPFKNYVSALVTLLEDADGMVRDTARNSVIALFQNASNVAKSDLKKQLKICNVRPTIVSAIVAHLGPSNYPETGESEIPTRSVFANSVPSVSSTRPLSQAQEIKIEQIEPAYVNTQRELESTFQEMHPCFEGRESEQNWLKREQSCTTLRKLNAGNAPNDFHEAYLVGVKGLLDGILKAVNSLRTSLSKEGCCLIQEITNTVESGLDPMVEILLQNLIKLCGGTKKISSQQGNKTVDIIISKVTYNSRILQHIWAACQDKNVQPRTYASGWLKTLLKKEAHHKSHIEHAGGLDLVEKCIRKGLADPNPAVREAMRSTYWVFASLWPPRAEGIISSLDTTQQKLLENAPDNPNSYKNTNLMNSRPGLGFSKSTSIPQKPSLKDTMLAQKKAALANRNLFNRPGSAMSSFSPVRNTQNSSTSSDISAARLRIDSTSISHGGLSLAPMRPSKLRATVRTDLATRPATAGPYSIRRPAHAPSYSESSTSPSLISKGLKNRINSTGTPKRISPRPSTSHSTHITPPNHTIPKSTGLNKSISPFTTSRKPKSSEVDRSPSYRLSNRNEELTMVIPSKLNEINNEKTRKNISIVDSSDEEILVTPLIRSRKSKDPLLSIDDKLMNIRASVVVPTQEDSQSTQDVSKPEQEVPLAFQPHSESNLTDNLEQCPPLLVSGIKKILSQNLDVHGFRKLQGIIREIKSEWSENKFGILLSGLFDYLEAPLTSLTPEKRQDVKVQVLATIKLMFKKDPEAFKPYLTKGLGSLLKIRSIHDSRAYIVSGLELLSSELIMICEPSSTIDNILSQLEMKEATETENRCLSMGLLMLKEVLNIKKSFIPSDTQLENLSNLAIKCLNSDDSGVRMDAVQLCVAIHERVGGETFWKVLDGMRDDPKSLITYYIVKQQKELATTAAVSV